MFEEIFPDFYRIEIPLPGNPLGALNSYLVKGDERFLIIDTGMNRSECLKPMFKSLESLDVDLNKTDFFITHLHADHLGLAAKLASENSKVYFNEPEATYLNSGKVSNRLQKFSSFYRLNGFPKNELKNLLEKHPGFKYGFDWGIDFSVLKEGDEIGIGDYLFKCIETPGHSPGHMCLYESDKKILVSGDHILFDITPNITWWPVMRNAMDEYLKSLEKVKDFDVDLVLPGHRSVQKGLVRRVEELQEHHQNRFEEVLSALREGSKTAWQVAPCITWDIEFTDWAELPPVQKWFAVGETIAHLNYLEEEGEIQRKEEDKIIYSLA